MGAAAAVPVAPTAEPVAVPIARFRTAYTRGHDTYDDAFSIEALATASGPRWVAVPAL